MTTAHAIGSAIAMLGLVSATTAFAADEGPGVDPKAAFARFKTLAGEWQSASVAGHPASKVVYQVTSNGSVVMETIGPGTDHEMVTMYHLDGGELKMVHYCAAGNQPRLKLDRKASTPDDLKFTFDGGSNIDPAVDLYMNEVRFVLRDAKHMESTWGSKVGGKAGEPMTFVLSRP